MTALKSDPSTTIEYVRLPDRMPGEGETVAYSAGGKPDPNGSVIISSFGVQFIWARFLRPVKAGQVAMMVFSNLPAIGVVMDGAATEWNIRTNEPTFGEAVVQLISIERGFEVARIVCRNDSESCLDIAVGMAAPIAAAGASRG
jgi:hypothetical protein